MFNPTPQNPSSKQKKRRSTQAIRTWIPAAMLTFAMANPGLADAHMNAPTTHGSMNSLRTLHTTENHTLVALGDSITFGYNLGNNQAPSPLAFPSLVAKKENLSVSNLGVPGWTSGDLLNSLSTDSVQAELKNASIITLDIGSNDLLKNAGSLLKQVASNKPVTLTADDTANLTKAIQGFSENLPEIVTEIRKITDAPIVIANLYDPIPDISPIHSVTEQFIAEENQIIMNVAAQAGCATADVYSAFNHKQFTLVRVLQIDVHPTSSGQQAIASSVESAIEKPQSSTPVYFATAPAGTPVYEQPDDTSNAIYKLQGIEGDVVTGTQDTWLQITTGNKLTGYVPSDKVNLLLRPSSQFTFKTVKGNVLAGTMVNLKGGTARSYIMNAVTYAPVSFLAKAAGAHVDWDNVHREVKVTSKSSPSLDAGGATTGGSTGAGSSAGTPSGSSASGSTVKSHLSTKAQRVNILTEGILVSVDGEPIRLTHEPVMINGSVYVPAREFCEAVGGVATIAAGDLQLIFAAGS